MSSFLDRLQAKAEKMDRIEDEFGGKEFDRMFNKRRKKSKCSLIDGEAKRTSQRRLKREEIIANRELIFEASNLDKDLFQTNSRDSVVRKRAIGTFNHFMKDEHCRRSKRMKKRARVANKNSSYSFHTDSEDEDDSIANSDPLTHTDDAKSDDVKYADDLVDSDDYSIDEDEKSSSVIDIKPTKKARKIIMTSSSSDTSLTSEKDVDCNDADSSSPIMDEHKQGFYPNQSRSPHTQEFIHPPFPFISSFAHTSYPPIGGSLHHAYHSLVGQHTFNFGGHPHVPHVPHVVESKYDRMWQSKFEQLQAKLMSNGGSLLREDIGFSLHDWLNEQRRQRNQNTLSTRRRSLLDNYLGVTW